MNWRYLTSEADLDEAIHTSFEQPVLIFKHSTRCSISSTALGRLERGWNSDASSAMVPYFLDLLQYRSLSNLVESRFGVKHESPQAIVIRDGEVLFHASHFDIVMNELLEHV